MSALLASPLTVTACASAAVALAGIAHPFAALALGVVASAAAALLAAASAGLARRALWSATSLATGAVALRVLAPLPPVELPGASVMDATRAALASALATLVPEPESGILLGIVLGERASIGPALREAFAATGTAHLLAISGFNMTLVAAAVAIALRGRVHPVGIAVATAAAVGTYAALVGPGPSVLRAALMASVGAIGLAIGRRGAAGNALGAAVTAMLILDPHALEDVGSLLSVSATAGLIVAQRRLATSFTRLPSPVAEGLAATLAASVPTIPIVAAVFGRLSLVSPLANLVAVPLFAPILLFGAATAAVGAILPAAAGPLAIAAFAATFALRVSVEAFAAVPFASAEVPSGPLTAVVFAIVIAVVAHRGPAALSAARGAVASIAPRLPPTTLRGPRPALPARTMTALVCVLALAAGLAATQAMPRPATMKIRALDVGQGDAFLVESAGRYALIDGGPDPSRLLRELGRALAPWHRRIDVVALTHEHADHGNGLLAVLERYDVGVAIEPAGMADEPLVRAWAERAERAGVRRVALTAGARVRLGHVTLRVLAPGRDRPASVPNLVILAEAPEGSVLFMADATDDVIADLLLAPDDLAARLYVPPHHGADSAHALALVEAVRPRAALISVGASNRYGHPTAGTLAALGSLPVYRTDRHAPWRSSSMATASVSAPTRPVFLLIGEDPFRARLRLAELVAALVAGGPTAPGDLSRVASPDLRGTIGVTRHDARTESADAIAMSGRSQGLFDDPNERRVVVVEQAEAITDPSFITSFPTDTALVLSTTEKMPSGRRRSRAPARPAAEAKRDSAPPALPDAVMSVGGSVERIAPLQADQVPGWITARARLAGATLEPRAVHELASAVGADTDRIENELRKLATFAGGQAITDADVRALVAGAIEADVFELTRAVVRRDARSAVATLEKLLADGQAPQQILALLLWQFRVLLFASRMEDMAGAEKAAKAIRSSANAIARWRVEARRISRHDVIRAYEALYATDLAIKQGRTEPETAMMLCVLDLCGVAGADPRDLIIGEPPRRGR